MPDSPLAASEELDEAPAPDEASPPTLSFVHAVWAFFLSAAVMLVIGYFTYDPQVFSRLLRHMHVGLLVAAVLSVGVRVLFGALRLYYVSGGRLTFRASLRGQLAWDFFSNITPSAIGGAPIAAFYIARDSQRQVGETTAFILFSMLLDQLWFAFSIPLLFAATTFLDVFPSALGSIGSWILGALFLIMLAWTLLFAYATLVRIDFLEKVAHRLFRLRWLRRYHDRVQREMKQLRKRAYILRKRPLRFFVNGFLITAGAWVSRYLTLLFIIWSVYAEIDQLLILFRTMALLLCSLALPTPGGSGGIEGLYALFIGPLIPEAVLAPTLVTWRFMAYYVFIAFGVYLTMHQVRKSLNQDAPSPGGHSQSDASPQRKTAPRAER